jgi:hypothetical protein
VAKLNATISITDIPEALAGMRRGLADILREVALDEPTEVGRRLREVAAAFEAGVSEWPTPGD